MTKELQTLKNETSMKNDQFRGENENLSSSADVLSKTSNLVTLRCCFADDGKEIDKNENALEERAKLLLLLTEA